MLRALHADPGDHAHGAAPKDPAPEPRHDRVDTPEKMEGLLHDAGFDSPHSWTNDRVAVLDAEHLIRLKDEHGIREASLRQPDPEKPE